MSTIAPSSTESDSRRVRFFAAVSAGVRLRGVALMGVCNITPDSFSENGAHFGDREASGRIAELVAAGADIVDIGGESTRPGAKAVHAAEQKRRVLPAIAEAVRLGAMVSVDTADPDVAAAALEIGACAVNDVSCLANPELARVVSKYDAAYVLMHARGSQEAMRGFSVYDERAYDSVVDDVLREWSEARNRAIDECVHADAFMMDPGLGFSKNKSHSETLLREVSTLVARANAPVLIGSSRKSFLTLVEEGAGPTQRLGASLATALFAAESGAAVVRVHDVRETRQAIDWMMRLRTRARMSSEPPRGANA